jgi:hypothetical protein
VASWWKPNLSEGDLCVRGENVVGPARHPGFCLLAASWLCHQSDRSVSTDDRCDRGSRSLEQVLRNGARWQHECGRERGGADRPLPGEFGQAGHDRRTKGSGTDSGRAGAGCPTCARAVETTDSPLNGREPVSSSYPRTASE